MLADRPTIAERVMETGTRGEGGDKTLLIDEAAEDVVFAELEALYAAGARFCAISEERGVVDFGCDDLQVVIDPIDGSLNAKRGLPHHALSIAVADGPTMADVVFGFVQDFGPEGGMGRAPRRGGDARRRAAGPVARRAPLARRQARGAGRRVGRPALGRPVRRRAGRDRAPAARDRRDRGVAVPGRRRPLRRDGVAEALPRGRRRGRAADRARGRRPGRVHRLRRPAGRAAGPRAALAGDRRAHARGPRRGPPRPRRLAGRGRPSSAGCPRDVAGRLPSWDV